jgi:glycosyltransferase involved in cell wall biosynthesis
MTTRATGGVRRVDQVIPTLAGRDAIGQHTLHLRDLLRGEGLASDIYYANASADVVKQGRHIEQLGDADPGGRWLLYQLSIGSPAADAFARRPEPKLVNYHNITPTELLRRWEPEVGEELRLGRAQLAALAPITTYAMADSPYNEQELIRAGYAHTEVAPLLIDFAGLDGEADPATAERLATERAGGGHDLLFVGKVAPHKASHDLIKALALYRRLYDPRARLHLVGGPIGSAYPRALEEFAEGLGLTDAVDFAGSVSHEALIAYYRAADVFVCLSDHEGFCVPLVEAMVHRVPIVAYGTAAVPDTVGDAGIVLPGKQPARVAAAIDKVVRDVELRALLDAAAAERLASLSLDRSRAQVVEVVRRALASGAPAVAR